MLEVTKGKTISKNINEDIEKLNGNNKKTRWKAINETSNFSTK